MDREAQVVHTDGGESLRYDALLIAVGGRQIEAFEHVTTFRDAEADETYQGVVQDVEEGYSKGVVFLLPDGPVWPLPLYELALMTAERAYSMGIDELELSIVTPEVGPMAIFGVPPVTLWRGCSSAPGSPSTCLRWRRSQPPGT